MTEPLAPRSPTSPVLDDPRHVLRRALVACALVVALLGAVNPTVRELRETRHQFEAPFVLDSSSAQTAFDLAPTPWESTLSQTVDWLSETAA